ncbi:unnamed protein product [Closterium sp. NIES-54]
MDVWGPARVSGQGRDCSFLLSVSSSASGSARTFLSCVCTLSEVVSSPPTSCGTSVVGRASSSRSRFQGVVLQGVLHLGPGGAEPEGAEPGGGKTKGAEPRGAESEGAESGGARVSTGAGGTGGAGAAGPGGAHTGGTGAARAGGVGGAGAEDPGVGGTGGGDAGAGGTEGGDPGAGGTGAGDPGAGGDGAGAGAGGTGAGGAGAGDPRAGDAGAGGAGAGGIGAGGTVQRRAFFASPPPLSLQPRGSVLHQPDSPLPAPSPYADQTDSLAERREPESRLASPIRAIRIGRRVPRPRPRPVPDTHIMALFPSSVPLQSTAASALVVELVDFAAACRLDYAASLVAESESDYPPSVGGECALGTDVLEVRQEDFECLAAALSHLVAMLLALERDPDAPDIPTPRSYAKAIEGPYSSQWQTAMDVEMASWKSTSTYVDAFPPYGANIVDGMWIFRVKLPPGSPPVFKARYVARGFSQRQGFDLFQTFSPTPKMTTLRKIHTCTDLDELRNYLGLQITRDIARRNITLTRSHMVHQVLQRFGFWFSSPQSTPLPTDHSLLAPPSDESVEPCGLYPELVGCLMYLMTCTRPDLTYPLSILARYVVPERHRPENWEAAKRVLRYLCSTSGMGLVLGGRLPVVLTRHADAS